ncbi:MAG: hypothetical protein KC414_07355 [Romboutsia sp.]|nr:hypothetical protein [Romboutsia sp.]
MIKLFFCCNWNKNNIAVKNFVDVLTPGNLGIWGNFVSTSNPNEADYYIVLEDSSHNKNIKNVLAFPQEPPCIRTKKTYLSYNHSYKFTYNNIYHVISNFDLLSRNDKTQGFDYWRDLNYESVIKNKNLSAVISSKKNTSSQKLRYSLVEILINSNLDINIYGRGLEFTDDRYLGFIQKKSHGLIDYNYSICIENCSIPNYFTEKFTDAILCWTIPIYWGCRNIEKYFPEHSYYLIDITDKNIIDKIKEICKKPITDIQIKALQEARRRVLYEYNIWPTIEAILTQ